MDDLDHALLQRLTRNARAPAAALAKALKVSRGTVQNRIDKLIAAGVIERFTVALGPAAADRQVSAFALIKLTASDDRDTRAALLRIDAVTDIHTLSGPFDLVVDLRVDTLTRLDSTLDRIRVLPAVADTQCHIRLAPVERTP
ncbi:MAG: Lrp/AsnC family transcriptional regulator [Pseudomonadota bacterium]